MKGALINKKEFDVEYCHGPEYAPEQFLLIKDINSFEFVTNIMERKFNNIECDKLLSTTYKSKKKVLEIKEGIIKEVRK